MDVLTLADGLDGTARPKSQLGELFKLVVVLSISPTVILKLWVLRYLLSFWEKNIIFMLLG